MDFSDPMSHSIKAITTASNENTSPQAISQLSKELVIGLVGYAGAGCSAAASRIRILLEEASYIVQLIKLSDLISGRSATNVVPKIEAGIREGKTRFDRACALQNMGDQFRKQHGPSALSALVVRKIIDLRGASRAGEQKIAFVLDSLKHPDEIGLLRRVYDTSFRLVAVHCERSTREKRLIGSNHSSAKFKGVDDVNVKKFMERDEKDIGVSHGQQVREAFYLADFFIDNNVASQAGENLNVDLDRFVNLLLGSGVVRPTRSERAMYHAHAAALQSSCLSRQVGAALTSRDGAILGTGTNDVPRFGGGVYDEDSSPDHRCFAWKWTDGKIEFKGCHNQRRKVRLREDIASWLAENLTDHLALAAHPKPKSGMDTAAAARREAAARIRSEFLDHTDLLEGLPGIKEIVEYSRSIHAEMSALLSASRSGISPVGTSLYCTTYPCHNCARHLVCAGVEQVYYIEPYVKSLAAELHYDAITTELPKLDAGGVRPKADKMVIVPFTGVGPRMYEDFFVKRGELKDSRGSYLPPEGGEPAYAVRLRELAKVEEAAAALVPDDIDA
jgi:deoxycytidylate deaminase